MSSRQPVQNVLPILLIAAIQGWLLYGLHWSLEHKAWPATDLRWLVPLCAIALFVPITLQILVEKLRQRPLWIITAIIALLAAALGAYTGWTIDPVKVGSPERFPLPFVFYAAFFSIWFIALPFAQTWFRTGDRSFPYHDLFEFSWQNALLLFEAALFTGIFWGLLGLWAALFKVVDISFFADLFSKPAFIYPATAIAFGYAIYLIQSRESIVVTLRRHLLGVFSWLFPLVAAISIMFLLVLPFTGLAPLWRTGHATFLMLWLQALLILFLNAAYEDGRSEPAYSVWLRSALRVATLGMPLYAAMCAYSLGLRVDQHGWTVDRIWAALITLVAALYGLGYAAAALRGSPWMGRMGHVNVIMAWVVVALLVLVSSPALDPKYLSTNSQISRLSSGKVTPSKFDYDYLRFQLGRYGTAALAELAKGTNQDAARLASLALAKTSRWWRETIPPAEDIATRIEMYPIGTTPELAFLDYLRESVKVRPWDHPSCLSELREPCLMLALDLNRDGQPEILSFDPSLHSVYSKIDGKWMKVGLLIGERLNRKQTIALLRESRFQVEQPTWLRVRIGDQRFTVHDQTRPPASNQKRPDSK